MLADKAKIRIFSKAILMAGAMLSLIMGADPGFAATAGKALPVSAAVASCASLAAVDLTDIGGAGSKVTSVKEETINGIAMCSVDGMLAPSNLFSVKLPVSSWTQRFMQVGCGGLCGHVPLDVGAADGCLPLNAGGFVISGTDMGHEGPDPSFGRDPQLRVDFAYRAVHLTALASKKLINAFYGKAPAYSYFNGCSDGGREAVMEAQRFPEDFDGIIAGAPAMLFQFQNSLHHGWLAVSNTGADGKPVLLASKLPLLHSAVLKACDGLDGQVDGLLSEPRLCKFDPATLQCAADAKDTTACLTAAEVGTAKKFYDGPHDPASGQRLLVGSPQYGSELGWAGVSVPMSADKAPFSAQIALDALKNLIFEHNPPADYSLKDLQFSALTVELLKSRHSLLDATNPDLGKFEAKGGKLILWHGWADEHISPITTIAYHEALIAQMGQSKVDGFERLYLLPGVHHCGNGEGPSAIDLLSASMNWVENGQAPDAIQSSTQAGPPNNFGQPTAGGPPPGAPAPAAHAVAMSRPVYPYPALAKYDGKGDPNLAASYTHGEALYSKPVSDWAGADFFKPYQPRQN